jgi:hypothetical protein
MLEKAVLERFWDLRDLPAEQNRRVKNKRVKMSKLPEILLICLLKIMVAKNS